MVFFFNDTATAEIYTLSLHDALPISRLDGALARDPEVLAEVPFVLGEVVVAVDGLEPRRLVRAHVAGQRSEEHTSELQSRQYLVCRLLLEKKKPHSYPLLSFLSSFYY